MVAQKKKKMKNSQNKHENTKGTINGTQDVISGVS